MLQKCLKALLSKSAQAQAQMLYLKKCLKAPSSTLKNVLKALLSTSTLVLDPCLLKTNEVILHKYCVAMASGYTYMARYRGQALN